MAATGLMLAALSLGGEAADIVTILIGDEPVKGVIVTHGDEGFTFLPADVETPVRLSWRDLGPGERERLEQLIGPAPETGHDEVPFDRVDGVIVTLRNGRKLRGVLLPERETEDAVFIRTNVTPHFEIKKPDIVSIERAKLPAAEVYGPEELYDLVLAEIKPVTARDHFETARRCIKLGLWEHARDHLVRCRIIDPLYGERTEEMLARIELMIKEKEARGLYEAVQRALAAGDYEEALSLIDRAAAAYPDSSRITELIFLKPEVEAERRKVLRRDVVGAGYGKLDELIRRKVWNRVPDAAQIMGVRVLLKDGKVVEGKLVEETDRLVIVEKGNDTYEIPRERIRDMRPVSLNRVKRREATFAECKEYVTDAEGGITVDLMAALSRRFGIAEEEVKGIWENRSRRRIRLGERIEVETPPAQLRKASYGQGTWLREGGVEPYAVRPGPSGADVHGPGSSELEQDVERWWSRLPRESRYRILQAACVDAVMEVVKVMKERCSQCGGRGYAVVHGLNALSVQKTCPRCRGLGCTVRLLYR